MKASIFVEGYTELAFVREFLLRYHNYSKVDINCVQMRSNQYINASYNYPDNDSFFDDANGHSKYFIIDCGGDQITSKILKREEKLINTNYDRIIGLRDVYSEIYRKNYSNEYNAQAVQQFIADQREVMNNSRLTNIPELHFSIMEIESWYLAMKSMFARKSTQLTPEKIEEFCGVQNPEEIYHPATVMEQIFIFSSDRYKKREAQSDSLSNYPLLENFEELYMSNSCNSFNEFCQALDITFL